MANTFTERFSDEIEYTTYIPGNGFSGTVLKRGERPLVNSITSLDCSSWATVNRRTTSSHIEARETNHRETYGSVFQGPMTDFTIKEGQDGVVNRIRTHRTQPHLPHIGTAYREDRDATELKDRGYELFEERRASREDVYEAYKETLRWMLNDAEELLRNVDAEKVVVSADHGEAFGEYLEFGHKTGSLNPTVRRVPWVETTASDTGSYVPSTEPPTTVEENEATDNLAALGYKM